MPKMFDTELARAQLPSIVLDFVGLAIIGIAFGVGLWSALGAVLFIIGILIMVVGLQMTINNLKKLEDKRFGKRPSEQSRRTKIVTILLIICLITLYILLGLL